MNGPSEKTAGESPERPAGGSLGPLRAVALTAVVAGAVGSVWLMLVAGHPPLFLRVIFVFWVLAPFVALLVADKFSKRWSVISRATLHIVMLVLTLGSLAIYGNAVLHPRKSQPAAPFVAVPVVSCLLMVIVVPIAALISGRLSRRGDGA